MIRIWRPVGGILLLAMLVLASACGDATSRSHDTTVASDDATSRNTESSSNDDKAFTPDGESQEIVSPGFDPEVYASVADSVSQMLDQYADGGSTGGSGGSGGPGGAGDSGSASGTGDSSLFNSGTDAEKAETALNLADDMAVAVHMGQVTPEMLKIGGDAVLGYPHPLLLNNYGAMVMYAGEETQAEPFFRLAVLQDSGNPVFLTNLASVLLEEGDDAAAEQFIDQALSIDNEYGPAYQVLTTIHLKRDQSELAAETMVKGAWHYFDDLTEYHFKSFLAAVEELDPAEDDYPLKDEYLDILYKIARENVDTLDNGQGTDTPGSQLNLKPYPSIAGQDNLIKAQKWLNEQIDEISDKQREAGMRADEHKYALERMYEDGDPEQSVFPVMKNMRQYYAVMVMISCYDYKIRQAEAKSMKDMEDIRLQTEGKLERMSDTYDKKLKDAEKQSDEAFNELFGQMAESALGTKEFPDFTAAQKQVMLPSLIKVDECKARLDIQNQHVEQCIPVNARYAGEMKQLLEEYWLKTGGLLKYVADEEMFEYLAGTREEVVWQWLWKPLQDLRSFGGLLEGEKQTLNGAEVELEMVRSLFEGKPYVSAEKDEEDKDLDYGSVIPELEKESFTTYPEPGDHGEVGVEGDLFGVVSGSASFDGDNLKWEGDTPFTKHTGGVSTLGGSTFSSTLRGISVEGDTSWITNLADMESLGKAGKAGKWLGSLGKISFTKSENRKVGTYTIRDANGRITDHGVHYIHETGSGVWDLGKSEKIEVTKSYVTGVAIKKSSTKYKFKFATYEE